MEEITIRDIKDLKEVLPEIVKVKYNIPVEEVNMVMREANRLIASESR